MWSIPQGNCGIVHIYWRILNGKLHFLCSAISSGLFPSNCKIAKLKLLYKRGSKTNLENFSFISVLLLTSKIFERIVYDQVDNFLRQNNILYNYQSRFRKDHSADFCLSFLNDKILKGFDKRLFMEWFWLIFKTSSV